MQDLPINDVLADIQACLNSQTRVVLQAPPGAGKTTMVPVALLHEDWLQGRQIILLEPRRLAARNAAARMAWLLNEKVGQTVGYQIRQDNCYSDQTRILVVTEGILTRKLQADPELGNTALVIFDEFHERSLHADLSLALCLQSQQILRPELKILVMSATLNTTAIADLLDGAPIIQSEGRSYPVDVRYLEKNTSTAGDARNGHQQLMKQLLHAVKQFLHEQQGNCLVFLPGVKEINQLAASIAGLLDAEKMHSVLLAPLHGNLGRQQQDQAIAAPAAGMRKIVLATNIAETSLTIDGIDCVIDAGLERILQYNPANAMNSLQTQVISVDSAEQRSGRAGRLAPGVCYRMWTRQQQQRMVKHTSAEILHSDLSSLVLELANWGVQEVDELHWLDKPPASAVQQASTLLKQLHAIDGEGKITPHGQAMLSMGTHPRLSHMMLSAVALQQAYHACLIAAILGEKDLFLSRAEKTFDIHERLNVLRQAKLPVRQDIDIQQCRRIRDSADDFFRRLQQYTDRQTKERVDSQLSGVLLACAYPDRIARLRDGNTARYLLSNGKGAVVPVHLQQHFYEYLVIASLDAMQGRSGQGEAAIYLAAEITAEQLEDYFPDLIEHRESVEWNEAQQRVESRQITSIGNIVLQQSMLAAADKQAVQQCLLQAIRNIGLQCLNWSPQSINLKQRLAFIHHVIASHPDQAKQFQEKPLADFSDEALLNSLEQWLQPHLDNENSIRQCQKLDMFKLLQSQLDWDQQQIVDRLAPEKITVPSGSAIRIDYSDPAQPVLAVRLQEVFGLYETPCIFNGQCKLMMHLLSPAHRPMQVTQDLHSFWQTTYHQVKKELRGKYKRHYWPDDPFTAQATSKTRKNMNRDSA